MSDLTRFGWNDFFEGQVTSEETGTFTAGRIFEQHRGLFKIRISAGLFWARTATSIERDDPIAIGDWVLGRPGQSQEPFTIVRRLERRNKLSRKAPLRKGNEQCLGANIDTAFIVTSLNQELNLRRLERYLTLIREAGVAPVVVLTKADISTDLETRTREVQAVALETPVHVISDTDDSARRELIPYFGFGKTVLLLGSSGVGKSTLVNLLLDSDSQHVSEVRETDGKGRHTTTARRLLVLPSGGMLIDSPGMRELQLLDATDGVRETFDDLIELARGCRFSDCRHDSEPKCAVRDALAKKTISAERYASFRKLLTETEKNRRDKKRGK